MTAPRRLSAGRYARAIESLWAGIQERPVVLSPKEWQLIDHWYRRGIPLKLIREAVRSVTEARRRHGAPRSLSYIAASVAESWEAIREGRLVRREESAGAEPPGRSTTLEVWAARRDREPAFSPLRELLTELLTRLKAGEDPAAVERRLEEALRDAAPVELRREVEREVRRELEPYRERMRPEVLESTHRQGVVAGLRRKLGLPALAAEVAVTPEEHGG